MNDKPEQQAVPVAQEDREAAAKLYWDREFDQHGISYPWLKDGARCIRDGKDDDGVEVQAFARHRLASLPCKSGEGAGERVVKYALEWRNGGEWKRDNGFAVPGNLHATRQISDREEALREMTAENGRWIDTAEHRLIEVVETVIGHAAQKGCHVVTDPALLAPDATQAREAELVAAIEAEINNLKGADTWWAIGIRTRLRAALNARGGA